MWLVIKNCSIYTTYLGAVVLQNKARLLAKSECFNKRILGIKP